MAMKAPSLTPEFMSLLKAQQKADALAVKRQKERTAELKKQTKEQKAQAALAKAKAVLDKSEKVMNMDLIQNTAALMGKVTADETLRLKLQQAILLGNADSAGNLAQQLLASQIAAMKLSSSNPLGGFTDSIKAALDALRQMRDELAKLGAEKVPVTSLMPIPSSVIPPGFGAPQTGGGQGTPGTQFPDLDYIDDFTRRNKTTGQLNVTVSIDPSAAAYGINAAVVGASANGTSSTVNRNGFFNYGN
jgi:hypothetical protein